MGRSRHRRTGLLAFVVLIGATLLASQRASAACYPAGQRVPQPAIDKFLANPGQALADNPDGSPALVSTLRDLVASDPNTLTAVIGLLATAKANPNLSDEQKIAIEKAVGKALGQAAQACLNTDPTFAGQIPPPLALSGDQVAIAAYTAETGDRPIGGIGGGGGGGAASAGASGGQTNALSGTTTGGSSFQAFGSNSTANTATNYFSGGASGGASVTTTTTVTNNAITSVSP